jgi:transcriptional regulator NrdR family protein
MRCPVCDAPTTVLQTRERYQAPHPGLSDFDVRRRRVCSACGFRFTTYESVDMSRETFARARFPDVDSTA